MTRWMNISKRLLLILLTIFIGVSAYADEFLELDNKLIDMIQETPYTGTFHNEGALDDIIYEDWGKGVSYLSQVTGTHIFFIHPEIKDGTIKSDSEAQSTIQSILDKALNEASKYDKYTVFFPGISIRKHSWDEPGYDKLDNDEKFITFDIGSVLHTHGLSFKEEQIFADVFSDMTNYRVSQFVNYLRVGPELYESMKYSAIENDAFVLAGNFIYYDYDINYWNIITQWDDWEPEVTLTKLFSQTSIDKHFGFDDGGYKEAVKEVIAEKNKADMSSMLLGALVYFIGMVAFVILAVSAVKALRGNKSRRMEAVEIKAKEVEIAHRKADLKMKEAEIEEQKAKNVATILKAPLNVMTATNDEDLEDEYGFNKITTSYVQENADNHLLILQWYKDINYNGFNKDKYTVKAMEEIFNIAFINKLVPREKHLSHYDDFQEWLKGEQGGL